MKPNVFLIEDESEIALLIRHHLEGAGFAASSFLNGSGVVQAAEATRPSLFLLDIMLPGGNGLDLCRRLRKAPTLTKVPIIFVTARTGEPDRAAGLELGADELLDAVWQESRYVTDRSMDVYARRLRGKVEKDPENPRYLRTVRGAGYRFDAIQ
jgi:DNA-binding response OmpR family regulator